MPNYNVSVTYTANGTQTVFSFPFDYLRKAFVYVEKDETTVLTQGTDYSVSEKTVVFPSAPAAGTVLRIYRQTDTTRLVSWADASVLRAKDMTAQQVQELHILEEQQYWVQENAIIRDGKEWKARNFPIKNVGDPVDAKDATNKDYVDSNFMKLAEGGNKWDSRGKTIDNLPYPSQPNHAATMGYVDTLIAGVEATGGNTFIPHDNVESMKRNTNLVPGMTAFTKGYYTPNDGGAGVYTIRTKTQSDVEDGGMTIFLDNGNVAERIANIGWTDNFAIDNNGKLCQIV